MTAAFLAVDRNGTQLLVPLETIRAMAPDDEMPDTTLLFLDDDVVTVDQPYEDLIDQFAADPC